MLKMDPDSGSYLDLEAGGQMHIPCKKYSIWGTCNLCCLGLRMPSYIHMHP